MIAELRQATREYHKTLESLLYSDKIMSKTLQENELAHILQVNYIFLKELEQALENKQWFQEFNPHRAHLAAQDLRSMGSFNEASEKYLGEITEFSAIGHLYVALGSALGGQLISKKLARTPNLQENTYSFFNSGEADLIKWQLFLNFIDEHSTELDKEKVVKGAVDGFKSLIKIYKKTTSEKFIDHR